MGSSRYIRQTSLKGFGEESQEKLKSAKVVVVGAGGLGIPVLQYLTAMGVGTIGIVENDLIEISNLQRQVIYKEKDVGKPKLHAAIRSLSSLNGDVEFLPFKTFLNKDNALEILSGFDVVVDATDNFPTRYLINDACVLLNKPFVYGALHAFEGQVSVFNYKNGPTYRCLFPNMPKPNEIPDCNENGVLGVIPSIIGSFQALEVIKILTDIGNPLAGELLIYDGLNQHTDKIKFKANPINHEITKLNEDYGQQLCEDSMLLSTIDFLKKLTKNPHLIVIDVRSPAEYKSGHLENSMNIPLQTLGNSTLINSLSESSYYVLCQSGARSETAVNILSKKYPDKSFKSIIGGYNAFPLESTPTKS